MIIHELKTWPKFYEQIRSGNKTFEIRKNDRNFQLGDMLKLREWNPETEEYTSSVSLFREITYITDFGMRENYVCIGFKCSKC